MLRLDARAHCCVPQSDRRTYWSDGMKEKLCDLNPAAVEKLPEKTADKSGIGVHYIDAYLKPFNAKLPDGTPDGTAVKAKRRGLKITLTVGTKKGEGLMR